MSKKPNNPYVLNVVDNSQDVYVYLRRNNLQFEMDVITMKECKFTIFNATPGQKKEIKALSEFEEDFEDMMIQNTILVLKKQKGKKYTFVFKYSEKFYHSIDDLFEQIKDRDIFDLIWICEKGVSRKDSEYLRLEIAHRFTMALLD